MMIPWVCIFYSVQKDGHCVKQRLVYRGEDFERKIERGTILKMVLRQGLGDIPGLEAILDQEVNRCQFEGLNYSMAIYYNHVLVEADIMNTVFHEGATSSNEIIKEVYFQLQNLYQDVLK